jgi:hypothetical protein
MHPLHFTPLRTTHPDTTRTVAPKLVRRGAAEAGGGGEQLRALHEPARGALGGDPPVARTQGPAVRRAAEHPRGLARGSAVADLHLWHPVRYRFIDCCLCVVVLVGVIDGDGDDDNEVMT